jgi:NIMA (never in mitosis gene a)-related kinase
MIKNFQILSKIGEGAYSQVYKVRRISDNTIIASIRHPNIICYKEAFWENNSNSLW